MIQNSAIGATLNGKWLVEDPDFVTVPPLPPGTDDDYVLVDLVLQLSSKRTSSADSQARIARLFGLEAVVNPLDGKPLYSSQMHFGGEQLVPMLYTYMEGAIGATSAVIGDSVKLYLDNFPDIYRYHQLRLETSVFANVWDTNGRKTNILEHLTMAQGMHE